MGTYLTSRNLDIAMKVSVSILALMKPKVMVMIVKACKGGEYQDYVWRKMQSSQINSDIW